MNHIIPRITKIVTSSEILSFPVQITYCDLQYSYIVEIFAERLKKCGYSGQLVAVSSDAFLMIRINPDFSLEEYEINITTDGIKIEASGSKGVNYAFVTLFHLVRIQKGKLTCGIYHDKPRYEYRGFMLDVARHFFCADEVKKIIEQCALLKLNRFHWHLSDDQGFRVESESFSCLNTVGSWREEPVLQKDVYGGYYSKEEIRDIVVFAADRGIEIVPEIDMPGHTSAIIAAYPELSCSGKSGKVASDYGIHENILCAGKTEVYDFLEGLLDEMCKLFPGEYFHIGGDEAPKAEWKNCPHCNKLMQEKGFNDYEQLQAYFTGRVADILKKRGKKIIGWNEILKSGQCDPDAVAQYWVEAADENYTCQELQKGRRIIFSNTGHFYFDFPYADITMKATYSFAPAVKGASLVSDQVGWGIEAPLWTEQHTSDEAIEYQIFPRLLALAENAWSGPDDFEEFVRRIKLYYEIFEIWDIHAAPCADAVVDGKEGIKKAVEYYINMMTLSAQFADKKDGELFLETPIGRGLDSIFTAMMREHWTPSYTEDEILYAEKLYREAVSLL